MSELVKLLLIKKKSLKISEVKLLLIERKKVRT